MGAGFCPLVAVSIHFPGRVGSPALQSVASQVLVDTPLWFVCVVLYVLAGDRTTNSLADTVREVTWVDGTGKVRVSKKGDPEFAAFNGGLGIFGIMTELLIQLTPLSNTELITVMKKDKNMMEEINKLLKVMRAPTWAMHHRGHHRLCYCTLMFFCGIYAVPCYRAIHGDNC